MGADHVWFFFFFVTSGSTEDIRYIHGQKVLRNRMRFASLFFICLWRVCASFISRECEDNKIIVGSTAFPCGNKRCAENMPTDIQQPGVWFKKHCVEMGLPTEMPNVSLPYFNTSNTVYNFTRREGQSLTMRCRIQNMHDMYRLQWLYYEEDDDLPNVLFKNNRTFATDNFKASVLVSGNYTTYDLTILNVMQGDGGLYVCQLKRSIGKPEHKEGKNYTVTIQYAAEVKYISRDESPGWMEIRPNKLHFNESDNASLICHVAGEPSPAVSWYYQKKRPRVNSINLSSSMGVGRVLHIPSITRHNRGFYTCQASNSISAQLGNMSTQEVQIVVQYAPEVDNSFIELRKAPGEYERLMCRANANPSPTYQWLKDGIPLKNGSVYVIIGLEPQEHYGNYTCVASNLLGTANVTFEVHGRPRAPIILSKYDGIKRHSFELEWSREERDGMKRAIQVDVYTIYYRRIEIQRSGEAITINYFPPDDPLFIDVDGSRRSHTLTELRPNSTYEVEICPQNRYGFGECAKFEFRTPNGDVTTTISTSTKESGIMTAYPRHGKSRSAACSPVPTSLTIFTISLVTVLPSSQWFAIFTHG